MVFWTKTEFQLFRSPSQFMDIAFLGRFPIYTGPPPSPPRHSPNPTNNVGRLYPDFFPTFYFVQGGRRDNCKKISKRMYCFKREPRNDRKIWIEQYCPKDFSPGLNVSLCKNPLRYKILSTRWMTKMIGSNSGEEKKTETVDHTLSR